MTQPATAESTGPSLPEASVHALKERLRGAVITPRDEGYEQARRVWNGNIDRRPALIVRCQGVADVMRAVDFAQTSGLRAAIRGGAHNAAGHGTCDGGIVIDLSPMKGIQVDPSRRTAHAQGGVVWAELDRETQAFGLATTGGTVSNTGIAGLTLGGGLGWLGGLHGLTCDNLVSADVVTADAQFVRASAEENPGLFWALRGGGGNFGVVTSFQYQLHPIGPTVLGGMVLHPLERARDVLAFYRDYATGLPDAAEAHVALLTSPEGAPVLALLLGYNGDLQEGERILEPARRFGQPLADLVGPMPYEARQTMLDAGVAQHGVQRYWKSGFAHRLSDDLLDIVVEGAASFTSPMSVLLFFRIHGAATRVPSDATAFGLRQPQWDLNALAQWTDPAESGRHTGWARELWGRMEPHTEGSAYTNHIAADDRPEKVRASYGSNYERLVALKNRYDPANLFRFNANIRPGR